MTRGGVGPDLHTGPYDTVRPSISGVERIYVVRGRRGRPSVVQGRVRHSEGLMSRRVTVGPRGVDLRSSCTNPRSTW